MALPINEISFGVSIILCLIWAAYKFEKKHKHPIAEDIIDLITLTFLGPIMTVGAVFLLAVFNYDFITDLVSFKANIGLSGIILLGYTIYLYYIILTRRHRKS